MTRLLPQGLGLLMGAFAASLDASPLRRHDAGITPGFARAAIDERTARVSP